MRNFSIFSFLFLAGFLAGCNSTGPNWMANGYKYQDDTPISSPARTSGWFLAAEAEAPAIRYDFDATAEGVAEDILATLDAQILSTETPVFVAPKQRIDSLNAMFDHNLRKGLRAKGYRLANTPVGAAQILYHLSPGGAYRDHMLQNPATEIEALGLKDTRDFLFSVTVTDTAGTVLAEETRLQPLPKDDIAFLYKPYIDFSRPGDKYNRGRKPLWDNP